MDVLIRIKRLLIAGQYRFTDKATDELQNDGLGIDDAIESILNATIIKKVIRSKAPKYAGQTPYIIESRSYTGTLIYTKGKIDHQTAEPIFYVLISAKRSILSPEVAAFEALPALWVALDSSNQAGQAVARNNCPKRACGLLQQLWREVL